MKEITIRIPDAEAAKQFCRIAGTCPFDIDLYYNRAVVDAKSILGVLSMGFSKTLHVRMYGENTTFEAYCQKLHEQAEAVA